VSLEFTPANFAGLGQAAPMASIVDAAGVVGPITTNVAANVIGRFSRSRTLNVAGPYHKCTRSVNYRNWLVQTVPEPWILT
jgi:hypothetical protein